MPRRASTSKKFDGEIVLVGVESSGKTLLCRHLERMCASNNAKNKKAAAAVPELNVKTQPSIGVELLELAHGGRILPLREVGGSMQPVWHKYIASAAAVVLVADTTSADGAAGAVVELCDVLRQAVATRVLLFLNKRETTGRLPEETVRRLFDLDALEDVKDGQLKVLWGSALSGEGLTEVLDWCCTSLLEREELVAANAEAEASAAAAKAAAAKQNDAVTAEVAAAAEKDAAGEASTSKKRSSFSLRRGSSSKKATADGGAPAAAT
jgi:signal recognition particle receptor subunit beta